VPHTAGGILREIRLIRLILLGRFRGPGPPPFRGTPLPPRENEGAGNRAEPGAVPYLEDSRRRRTRPFPPREISFPNAAWFLPFLEKLVPLYGSLRAGNSPSRLPHSMPATYPRRWGEKVDPNRREEPHPRERSLYPVYLSAFIRRQCAAHRSGPPPPLLLVALASRARLEADSDRRSIPVTNNFYANSGSGRPSERARCRPRWREGGHAVGHTLVASISNVDRRYRIAAEMQSNAEGN